MESHGCSLLFCAPVETQHNTVMQKAYGSSYLLPGGRRQRDLHCGRMCCWRHHVQETRHALYQYHHVWDPMLRVLGQTCQIALRLTRLAWHWVALHHWARAWLLRRHSCVLLPSPPLSRCVQVNRRAQPCIVSPIPWTQGKFSHACVCLFLVTVHEKMVHLLLLLPCLLQLLPSNKLILGLEFLGKVGASGSMPQPQSSSAPFFAKSSTPPPSTGLGPFSGGLRLSGDHSRSFLGGRAHGSGDAVRSSPLARSTCAVGGVGSEGASIMLQAPTSAAIPKSAFAAALDSRPGWPPLHTELGGVGRAAMGPFSGLLCADPGLPKPSVPSCLNFVCLVQDLSLTCHLG